MRNLRTRDLAFLAMLTALAFLSAFFIRIPIMPAASFLRYDIKDVIIVVGGFLYGPLAALAVAIVVGILQMLMISEYGLIGFLMTFLSTAAFVFPASVIYKAKKNQWGAVIGLAVGCVSMTIVMMLWNYIMTPIYMGVARSIVVSMMIPVFLPFNLIKSVLNAAVTLIIFKPIVSILSVSKTGISTQADEKNKFSLGVILVAGFVAVSSILLILVLQGKI